MRVPPRSSASTVDSAASLPQGFRRESLEKRNLDYLFNGGHARMIDEPQRREQPAMRPAHRMERDLRPALTRPPDFEGFWAKTCEELSAVEPDVRRMPVTSKSRPFSNFPG